MLCVCVWKRGKMDAKNRSTRLQLRIVNASSSFRADGYSKQSLLHSFKGDVAV